MKSSFHGISVDKIITPHTVELMQQRKDFVIFEDNWQLLNEEEYEDWCMIHGIMNRTPRIMFHYVKERAYTGEYYEFYRISRIPGISIIMLNMKEVEIGYENTKREIEKIIK